MAIVKHEFGDSDIVRVEDVTGVIVVTIDAASLIELQDDEGAVILNFPRADIDAIFDHARANGCLPKMAKPERGHSYTSDHRFSDPNILAVAAYGGHIELLLDAVMVERLSANGKYRLRLTGMDVEVLRHHFADQDRRAKDAKISSELWHAFFGHQPG